MTHQAFDVAIVGGGVTGLFLARRLLRRGFSVTLVEREPTLANSPSTRNEGWLHAGTYHAWAIDDQDAAIRVAKRCAYGHEQIVRDFSDAIVEGHLVPSLAVLSDPRRLDVLIERWRRAGVTYRAISLGEAEAAAPSFSFPRKAEVFEVRERAVNTRLLLDAVLSECRALGAAGRFELRLGATPVGFRGVNTLAVENSDHTSSWIEAGMFVYSAGGGLADLVRRLHGIGIELRRFKTPLLVTKPIGGANVVCLLPGQLTIMNHRRFSSIGLTRDNLREEEACEVAAYSQRDLRLRSTMKRFLRGATCVLASYCCTKVDLGSDTPFPNLEPRFLEVAPNAFGVIPGKLTEAPFVADELAVEIWSRLDASPVAKRPGDMATELRALDRHFGTRRGVVA